MDREILILKKALKDAIFDVAITDPGLGDNLIIPAQELAKRFKNYWIYSTDKNPQPNHVDLRNMSGSSLLLMHKNISITNVSCDEILSLLSLYSSHVYASSSDVIFYSDKEYTSFLVDLFDSIINSIAPLKTMNSKSIDAFLDIVTENYADILERTIITQFFYTSVVVHVPKTLRINMALVIGESGYVHSGGPLIYVRKAEKANRADLKDEMHRFVEARKGREKPIYLVPYSEEHFSPYDSKTPVSTRNGIAGVKIQLKKHYIETEPLLSFINSLVTDEKLTGKITVAQGFQDYFEEKDLSKTDDDSSVWFIVDYALTTIPGEFGRYDKSSSAQYLMVYEQAIINENQLNILKERKPGWYASVTLPHTLSAALINITRSAAHFPSNERRLVFLDPFCGTGTTLFDAALRLPDAVVIGFDREPVAAKVIGDNADFLSRGTQSLRSFIGELQHAVTALEVEGKPKSYRSFRRQVDQNDTVSGLGHFYWAFLLIEKYILNEAERIGIESAIQARIEQGFEQELRDELYGSEFSLEHRMYFYLMWRALALGKYSVANSKDKCIALIIKEFEKSRNEYNHIVEIIRKDTKRESSAAFVERAGTYSRSMSIDPSKFGKISDRIEYLTEEQFASIDDLTALSPGIYFVSVNDSLDLLEKMDDRFDIIVTDPPYGFNIKEDDENEDYGLLKKFGKLPQRLLMALKPNGQLAVVLPAFARNGRQIPFYETRRVFTRQVVSVAYKHSRNLVYPIYTYPIPKNLFRKPYYWLSTSSLERSIAVFTRDANTVDKARDTYE